MKESILDTMQTQNNKPAYVFVTPELNIKEQSPLVVLSQLNGEAKPWKGDGSFWEAPLAPSSLYFDTETEGLFQSTNALMLAKEVKLNGESIFYLAQGKGNQLTNDIIYSLLPNCKILSEEAFWGLVYGFKGPIIGANPMFDYGRGALVTDTTCTDTNAMPIVKRGNVRIAPVAFGSGFKLNRYLDTPTKLTEDEADRDIERHNKNGTVTKYTRHGAKKGTKRIQTTSLPPIRDVLQLGACVLGVRKSLGSLGIEFGTVHQKGTIGVRDIGQNNETLKYLIEDVNTTEDVHKAIARLIGVDYNRMESKLYSSASIGKWVLRQMNITKPYHWERERLYEAYFGGRSEVNYIGLYPNPLNALDFFSQYPTLQVILNLTRFLLCKEVVCCDQTDFLKAEIEGLTIEDMRDPKMWESLSGIILKLDCDGSRVPYRTDTADKNINVSLPYVHGEGLWYSVFDYLAAKFIGPVPTIKEIVVYYPLGHQDGLQSYSLFGLKMHPQTLYLDLLKYRVQLKMEQKLLTGMQNLTTEETERLLLVTDLIYGVKIILNSTSYGSTIERHEKNTVKSVTLNTTGENTPINEDKNGIKTIFPVDTVTPNIFFKSLVEGPFTTPVIGVQITAAARLQIAIGERIEIDNTGHGLAQIDTDGLVVGESKKELQNYFQNFSPIPGKQYLEDDNDNVSIRFFGIAPKRYIKFNFGADGISIIPIKNGLKEHGLGAYQIKDRLKIVVIGWKVVHNQKLTPEEDAYLDQPIMLPVRLTTNTRANDHPYQKPYSFGMHTMGNRLYEWEDGDNEFYLMTDKGYTLVKETEYFNLMTKRDTIANWFAYRGKKYIQPEDEGWIKVDTIHMTKKIALTKMGDKAIKTTDTDKIAQTTKAKKHRRSQHRDNALIKNAKRHRGLLKTLIKHGEVIKDYKARGLTTKERIVIKKGIKSRETQQNV